MLLSLAVAVINLYTYAWSNEISSVGGDSAAYLLASLYYSSSDSVGYLKSYGNEIFFPPVFPLLLMLIDAGNNILAGHILVATLLLLSVAVLYYWLLEEGIKQKNAGIICILVLFAPVSYFSSMNIWSENLYILVSLLSVLFVASFENSRQYHQIILASLMVALAMLIRVAALPLLVSFIIYLLYNYRLKYWYLCMLSVLPVTLWYVVSYTGANESSPYLAHIIGSYSDGLVSKLVTNITELTRSFYHAWIQQWSHNLDPMPVAVVLSLIGLASLLTLAKRLISWKYDAIYITLYFSMLFIWPHPEEMVRYSWVIFPFLVAYVFIYAINSEFNIGARRISGYAITASMAFMIVITSLVYNRILYYEHFPEKYSGLKHTELWYMNDRRTAHQLSLTQYYLIDDLRHLGDKVPEGECVLSIKSRLVRFLSKREALTLPSVSSSEEEFDGAMKRCRYLYVFPGATPSTNERFYPMKRAGNRVKIVSVRRLLDSPQAPAVGLLLLRTK